MSLYLPCGVYNDSYENDMAIVRTKFHKVALGAFLILLMLVPQFLAREYVDKIIWIAIMVIGGMGIGLLTGYCGQITLGHAAFVAVGAYTSAILINEFHIHFLLTFPLAGLMAGLLGVIFGLPALRVLRSPGSVAAVFHPHQGLDTVVNLVLQFGEQPILLLEIFFQGGVRGRLVSGEFTGQDRFVPNSKGRHPP